MILTVFDKQRHLIDAVAKLHLGDSKAPFGLDPTYGKGMLHRGRPQPQLAFDIEPRSSYAAQGDVRKLQLADDSVSSVIFDPPFLAGGGETGVMHGHYSSYPTMADLLQFYSDAISELYRVLHKGGILVFKCQDINNGRTQGFSHCEIYNMAITRGFYALDLFILTSSNRMTPYKMVNQNHARKNHSYFWVFKKSERKNYRLDVQWGIG